MSSTPVGQYYAFDGYFLDPFQRRLSDADGRQIPLSSRAFDALVYMIEHRGEIIDKEPLMRTVWPNVVVDENSLNKAISAIRGALGDTPGDHRYIITIPGRGYQFVATVKVLSEMPGPEHLVTEISHDNRRLPQRVIGAVSFCVLLFLLVYFTWDWTRPVQSTVHNEALPVVANNPSPTCLPHTDKWFKAGTLPNSYIMGSDHKVLRSGSSSACIQSKDVAVINGFGTLMQTVAPDRYKGHRVRLSGYAKSDNIEGWAGFWMRVDTEKDIPNHILAFDNMQRRPIVGTTDWQYYAVVLDIAEESSNIAFGFLLGGKGTIWVDDLNLEIVSEDIPVTDLVVTDNAAWRNGPQNMDFED